MANFACLACRIAFKKPGLLSLDDEEKFSYPCPNCHTRMQYMGRTFKAPRRNALRQWRVVRTLIENGYRFDTYGGDPLPTTQTELAERLANQRPTRNRIRIAADDRRSR